MGINRVLSMKSWYARNLLHNAFLNPTFDHLSVLFSWFFVVLRNTQVKLLLGLLGIRGEF